MHLPGSLKNIGIIPTHIAFKRAKNGLLYLGH